MHNSNQNLYNLLREKRNKIAKKEDIGHFKVSQKTTLGFENGLVNRNSGSREVLMRQTLTNSDNNIPAPLEAAVSTVETALRESGVDYWLGGGLYELIRRNQFDVIKSEYQRHDTDFHILVKDREKVFDTLSKTFSDTRYCYAPPAETPVKIAFSCEGIKFEIPFLFDSEYDPSICYFMSWGKKGAWPLSENERQLFYHFDLPKRIFDKESRLKFRGFSVSVPHTDYVKLLYPNQNKINLQS